MSLSTCEICGGHIPIGPDATNRCENCGAGVFPSVGENLLQREMLVNAALRAENARLETELRSVREALEEVICAIGDADKRTVTFNELFLIAEAALEVKP